MTTGRIVAAIGLAAVTALAAIWASAGPTQATTFNPFFGPPDFYRLDPTTAGANSDVRAQFNVLPPSANFTRLFGGSITFSDWDVLVTGGAAIVDGSYVGELESVATLALANEGCTSKVPVTFNMIDANTTVGALAMSPNATLTAAITTVATSFAYTSAGDPIGPSDSNPAHTRAEIEIDSEQMLVTVINEVTNTYSGVTRGWNGTTPAAHAAGAQIRKVTIIFPAGPSSNLEANMAEDDGDLDNNGTAEFPGFMNGVADGGDAIPSYVRDSLDPDGDPDNGGYVTPHARYFGVAFVANTLIIPLQFVIMNPGALTVFPNLDWATTSWGYASISFLGNPLSPPSNSAISDFCGFTSDTRLFGITRDNACTGGAPAAACYGTGAGFTLQLAADGGCPGFTTPNECGAVRQTNPAISRSLRFYQYVVSQRDYDDDGHENSLDTCHSDPNSSWNPRAPNTSSGSDSDGDGLPAACDPNNASPNFDQDGDGWQNRIDNCPTTLNTDQGGGGGTTPNTFQYDRDVAPGQDVPDGGPASDDIGPACDVAGESCTTDGQGDSCSTLTPTGANGHYHATAAAVTICIGVPTSDCHSSADADGDGVVNAGDTCRDGANAPDVFMADTLAAPANAGDSTIIAGGGSFTVGSPIVINSPLETLRYITNTTPTTISFTPPLEHDHGAGDPVAQVAFAQSLRDLNNDGFSDISDIALLTGVFGSQGGDPGNDGVGDGGVPGYQGRFDPNYDSFVDISDVSALSGVFGARCGPP
jgi:hypothetical protein